MTEIPKPVELVGRGGCWFRSGMVEIHLGVQADFRAATKAHPALRCTNFDALTARLRQAGVEAVEAFDIPGVRRCHIADPFGNRIELIAGWHGLLIGTNAARLSAGVARLRGLKLRSLPTVGSNQWTG
jgi:hypothetical protein